jgi:hypothetical protein
MNLTEIGALKEARFMAEILISSPTMDNFARYRMALVTITRVFDCTMNQAAEMVASQKGIK